MSKFKRDIAALDRALGSSRARPRRSATRLMTIEDVAEYLDQRRKALPRAAQHLLSQNRFWMEASGGDRHPMTGRQADQIIDMLLAER